MDTDTIDTQASEFKAAKTMKLHYILCFRDISSSRGILYLLDLIRGGIPFTS